MSDEPLEQFERQIASMPTVGLPMELRGVILREVERELRAARWDQRLARVAVVLLVVGVGMNAALALLRDRSDVSDFAWAQQVDSQQSLVATAIVVAEATDAATAQQYARQLAAMAGRKLTDDETAAIDAAARRPVSRGILGNKG